MSKADVPSKTDWVTYRDGPPIKKIAVIHWYIVFKKTSSDTILVHFLRTSQFFLIGLADESWLTL